MISACQCEAGHRSNGKDVFCQSQVSLECRERATLLSAVWAHSSALVQLRCTLANRQALAHQEAVSGTLREEAFAAAASVKYEP